MGRMKRKKGKPPVKPSRAFPGAWSRAARDCRYSDCPDEKLSIATLTHSQQWAPLSRAMKPKFFIRCHLSVWAPLLLLNFPLYFKDKEACTFINCFHFSYFTEKFSSVFFWKLSNPTSLFHAWEIVFRLWLSAFAIEVCDTVCPEINFSYKNHTRKNTGHS